MRLFSYVVRYDSGFAPNPFFGFCTLATCKPDIRASASVGDWVIGSGSNAKPLKHGGYLVYAMRVTETLTFSQYFDDSRFQCKKPNLYGSKKQARGDNIYHPHQDNTSWNQLSSYHSNQDGTPRLRHIQRDTKVDRVLVSDSYVYFGVHGPSIPLSFRNYGGVDICKAGQGRKIISDNKIIGDFVEWIRSLNQSGYVSPPHDWKTTK